MSNEKPMDLAALIAGDGITTREQAGVAADTVIAAGWVSPDEAKAREAAARREALLEAREERRAEVERLTKSVGAFSSARDAAKRGWQEANDAIGRVRALIAAAEQVSPLGAEHERAHPDERPVILIPARGLIAALTEPERDEEGGR